MVYDPCGGKVCHGCGLYYVPEGQWKEYKGIYYCPDCYEKLDKCEHKIEIPKKKIRRFFLFIKK